MVRWKLSLALFALALVLGCGRQSPVSPSLAPDGPLTSAERTELDGIAARTRFDQLALQLGSPNVVELPAGSADALAAAVAEAGEGGVVLVRSGLHTESGTVLISHRITLVGEPGAVLESTTSPMLNYGVDVVQPALWVRGAGGSVIRGLELRPAGGIGGAGILVHESDNVSLLENNVHDYQFPIMMEKANRTKVWSNRVVCSSGWMTGAIPEADGIVVINGVNCLIADNTVADALFGIWPCDRGGRVTGNKATGCYIGIILCCVPDDAIKLPDGTLTGAVLSTVSATIQGNETAGNFTTGILAIDGANSSHIVNNNSHDNGTYDIELSGDSMRFGFFTPRSYNTTVVAGSFSNVRVKDCGQGNQVNGGIRVDTDTDPCN